MPKPKPSNPIQKHNYSLGLPADLYQDVVALAEQSDTTVLETIKKALRLLLWLNQYRSKHGEVRLKINEEEVVLFL